MQAVGEDLAKRFGAAAFVEYTDQDSGDETMVLSLDALRAAFAGIETEEPEEEEIEIGEEYEEEPADEIVDENGASSLPLPSHPSSAEVSPKSILEAMLFVGDRNHQPISAERAAEKMRNVSPEEIDQAVLELNQTYSQFGCPYEIQKEPAGYRLVLRRGFEPVQSKFYGKLREAVLSQSAVDTLAVVAYRQPLTAEDIQRICKQPSTALLNQLVKRGLLTRDEKFLPEQDSQTRETEFPVSAEKKKKTFYYRTTKRFLELFQLASLDDLPLPEDIVLR